jgi:uncharacterized membrane protein (DUF485 family)
MAGVAAFRNGHAVRKGRQNAREGQPRRRTGLNVSSFDDSLPVRSWGRLNLYSFAMAHDSLDALGAARWRVAIALTVAMMVVYFGFILLVAFDKPLLGTRVAGGLSLGMLLGALVILTAWVLMWIYVRWANTHYDSAIADMRQ